MTDRSDKEVRRYLRFKPENVEIAWIQFTDRAPNTIEFEVDAAGLVVEEAYGGCGLVVLGAADAESISEGVRCLVRVNNIGPVRGQVRWVKVLDDDVAKIGIEYLEQP